jgi:hypothetical protein
MFIFWLTRHIKIAKTKVSSSIKLAPSAAGGGAET